MPRACSGNIPALRPLPYSPSLWALAQTPRFSPSFTACFFVHCHSPSQTGLSSSRRRSEEHTSELQSRLHLVCRLLLDKKNKRCALLDHSRCLTSTPSRDD